MDVAIIFSMGLVGIMLSMLGMGLLIAYYGSSKTRKVGIVFYYLVWYWQFILLVCLRTIQ